MYIFNDDTGWLFEQYRKQVDFFPIIGAVIEGKQEGVIFANKKQSPSSFFVVHKFNFAQFIEIEADNDFDQLVIANLFLSGKPAKYRIYSVSVKWAGYLDSLKDKPGISVAHGKRERFLYLGDEIKPDLKKKEFLTPENFNEVDSVFDIDLASRFWSSKEDAIAFSQAIIVYDPLPVSVCYGAAESDSRIEIDVLTLESGRRQGYGQTSVKAFINNAMGKGLMPTWDCYSDNKASFELAQKIGFEHILEYDFYIITLY